LDDNAPEHISGTSFYDKGLIIALVIKWKACTDLLFDVIQGKNNADNLKDTNPVSKNHKPFIPSK
jgi:hypothetical protein